MIYKSNYFSKELRQGNDENTGTRRKAAFALFLGLLSFAIYFAALPLKESVLYDALPEIMQPSYFSTLYIYIHVALLLNSLYFIVYYDSLFFHEISRNSWYLLVKMGYDPAMMIFSKLAALLLSIVFVYTAGFFFTAFLTYFLKYSIILAYFPALYLAGLIDLIIIGAISMMLSPFIRTVTNARYLIFFSLFLLVLLKIELGYYAVLSNRVAMQNIHNLFDPDRSLFAPVAAVIVLTSALVCVIKARNIARYYNLAEDDCEHLLPPGVSAVTIDPKTGRKKTVGTGEKRARRGRIFDVAFTAFLVLFIAAALSINILILVINASTFGKEVSIGGVIPYIFKSSTMEPEIMLNDLAYFKQADRDQAIETGQIILFEEGHVIYVERVTGRDGNLYQVDIDSYPPMSRPGAMIKSVEREAILGVYSGKNRWLGALVLFANTIFGRLLFLLIPVILLFYHRPITKKLLKQI